MTANRVGYLLDRYPVLSQTFVSGEVDELRRQGVQVHVVALHDGDDVPDRRPDVTVAALDLSSRRLRLLRWRYRLLSPRRYAEFRRRLDQVHVELASGPIGVDWPLLLLAADSLRRAGAQHLHAHFAWNAASAAYVLSGLLALPWSLTAHANDIFSRQRNLDLKLRTADRVVTVCEYNRRWMHEHLDVQRPVDIVVCGVEVPPEGELVPDVDVVAVGRLVPKKGFDLLIRAAAIVRDQRDDLVVEIVGDGRERAALEALIAELGLGRTVRLTGSLGHVATLERIARGRVFCLPVRVASDGDRDSMPVVIKEAMARCVPVVASREVAVPEMVDDQVGRLVEPDDPESLAAALLQVLGLSESVRRSLGRAGRDRVLERFTLAGETAKLRTLFEERPTG